MLNEFYLNLRGRDIRAHFQPTLGLDIPTAYYSGYTTGRITHFYRQKATESEYYAYHRKVSTLSEDSLKEAYEVYCQALEDEEDLLSKLNAIYHLEWRRQRLVFEIDRDWKNREINYRGTSCYEVHHTLIVNLRILTSLEGEIGEAIEVATEVAKKYQDKYGVDIYKDTRICLNLLERRL